MGYFIDRTFNERVYRSSCGQYLIKSLCLVKKSINDTCRVFDVFINFHTVNEGWKTLEYINLSTPDLCTVMFGVHYTSLGCTLPSHFFTVTLAGQVSSLVSPRGGGGRRT